MLLNRTSAVVYGCDDSYYYDVVEFYHDDIEFSCDGAVIIVIWSVIVMANLILW